MAIFAFIVGCAYVSLFSDDIEVLHSIVNFLQNKVEKNDTGDSEENTGSSYRSEEGISSSSTDEGICSTISGIFIFFVKSISRIFFFYKINFTKAF